MSATGMTGLLGRVLENLDRVSRSGAGWSACCPAHDDQRASLSIGRGDGGRILIHCHAGCSTDLVLEALALDWPDLHPQGASGPSPDVIPGRQVEASYRYEDQDGVLLYEVVRYAGKDFRQRRPDGRGGWIYNLDDVVRVPYRLPGLRRAVEACRLIVVVEGEKDADRLVSLGFEATCNSGGAGKWTAGCSEHLRKARVIILPDNDEPGWKHAEEVAGHLRAVRAEVRVVKLPELAPKGDVSDWLDAGHTVQELMRLVEEAEPREVAVDMGESGDEPWPEPQPMPSTLPSADRFSELLLPASLRAWIMDIAERMQCPPDFAAVAAVLALASLIGRKIAIRPKRLDDWTVVSNLWGMVVGRPGVLKTPAVQEAINPLRDMEAQAAAEHRDTQRRWVAEGELAKVEQALRKKDLEKGLKAQTPRSVLIAEMMSAEPTPEPVRRRYIVNDATVEKLGEIMVGNPNGVLVYRDELIGFLRSLDREGNESARAFYLEAWNGSGRFTYDRIGRGTQDIEAAIVSVLGCIQPGPLDGYLRGAGQGGSGDDGLVQRFQLAVYPDIATEWTNVDRGPDLEARGRAFAVFQQLAALSWDAVGADHDRSEPNTIPYLRFDDEAQGTFDQWRARLEKRVRSGREHPAFESHLSKYRSLVPSLALLYHLAEGRAGSVGNEAVLVAIAWAEYLESHARRIYAPVIGTGANPAMELAAKIRSGHVVDGFSAKDVYSKHWHGLTTEETHRALALLIDLGWLPMERMDTGGRPKECYWINPRLAEMG